MTIHDVIDDVTQVETNVNLRESNSEVLVDIPNVLSLVYIWISLKMFIKLFYNYDFHDVIFWKLFLYSFPFF